MKIEKPRILHYTPADHFQVIIKASKRKNKTSQIWLFVFTL